MKIARLKDSPLLATESKNLLAALQLGILGFQGLMLLLLLFIASRQNAIANRKPTFAQLVNGDTIYISEKDHLWRYPEVTRKFITDWTTLTFNWEGKVTGTDQLDAGVKVTGNKKVPTNTWFASVMLEPKFAQASLKELSGLVPESVYSGQMRSVIVISHLSEPRQIAPGRWELDMVATRVLIDRTSGESKQIAFNRTFTVESVEIPRSPLGSNAPIVEQKVYQMRSAGLQITQIDPFNP
jgi:hypothetical protein